MGYILTRDNRYLGEHTCGLHHYGDQTLIRPCCVADARTHKANTMRCALSDQHPSYALFCAAWNCLTDAEQWQVGDIRAVYDHGPAGFAECDMQRELTV